MIALPLPPTRNPRIATGAILTAKTVRQRTARTRRHNTWRTLPAVFLAVSLASAASTAGAGVEAEAFRTGAGAYAKGRMADAFQEWQKAGAGGHAAAQYNLGLMQMKGIAVGKDYASAFRWFMSASRGGVPLAFFQIAKMLEDGTGMPKDYQTALIFLNAGIDALPAGSCRDAAERRRSALIKLVSKAALEQAIREAKTIAPPASRAYAEHWTGALCFEDVILATAGGRALADAIGKAKKAGAASRPAQRQERAGLDSRSAPEARKGESSDAEARPQYFVQAASYLTRKEAVAAQLTLANRHGDLIAGIGGTVTEATVPSLGNVFRVRLGPFDDRPAATALCDALRERNQSCIVIRSAAAANPLWLKPRHP